MVFSDLVEKVKKYPLRTALIVIGCGAGIVFASGVFGKKDTETRFTLAIVDRGMLLSSLSGSGTVSALTRLEVKPKASGDIVMVKARNGQEVKAGDVLVTLDSRDAQKVVRDASANLESARLSLQKLTKSADVLTLLETQDALAQAKRELEDLIAPPDALDLLQAEHALAQAKELKDNTDSSLKKSYEDSFNDIASAFLDMPGMLASFEDMWYKNTFERAQQNIDWYANQVAYWDTDQKALFAKNDVAQKYLTAKASYDTAYSLYRSTTRNSDASSIEKLLSESYTAVRELAETVKASSNYIDLVRGIMEKQSITIPSGITSHQTTLSLYTTKTNTHVSTLSGARQEISNAQNSVINSARSINERQEAYDTVVKGADASKITAAKEKVREKEEALKKIKSGADELDIKSQKLAVRRSEYALADAQGKLSDYTVRAPIDGVVANLNLKKGESVSSNSAIATIITKKQIAEITLNEVDVAKVNVGDKASLSFDALPELTLTGAVVDVDVIGTQLQGVVSYITKITMDALDMRVKPSMSVTVSIITDKKQNVLRVPNSAVKASGERHYVEMPDAKEKISSDARRAVALSKVVRQPVEIGATNDEYTEIFSGLAEGDRVITGKITSQSRTSSVAPAPAVRVPGLPGQGSGGGGNVRFGGGGGFR